MIDRWCDQEKVDVESWRIGEAGVGGDEGGVEFFGEDDVEGVGDGEVSSSGPCLGEERRDLGSLEWCGEEIGEGGGGSLSGDVAGEGGTADDSGDFDVEVFGDVPAGGVGKPGLEGEAGRCFEKQVDAGRGVEDVVAHSVSERASATSSAALTGRLVGSW